MDTQLLRKKPSYIIPQTRMDRLYKKLHSVYQRSGETNKTIRLFNKLASEYHSYLSKNDTYKQLMDGLHKLGKISLPYSCCLLKTPKYSFSVHKLAKGMMIPRHAHPQKFSLLIVQTGRVCVMQSNRGESVESTYNQSLSKKYLYEGDTSSGLLIENNLHEIKVLSKSAILLSIRIQYCEQEATASFLNRFISVAHAPLFCAIFPLFASHQTVDAGELNRYIDDRSGSHLHHVEGGGLITAERVSIYRQSKDYNRQVEAVEWYLQSAKNGNANSQYWLGVMYLDGSGITEDDDEALKWLDLAAKQGHKEAEQLLNHLIESDFDMEC